MTETKSAPTKRDRELQRRDWLMIYIPLIIGIVLALTLVITIAIPGFQEANLGQDPASVWGDTAAIIVILQAGVIGLMPLVVFVGLCALAFWLFIKIHPLLKQGQEITEQVSHKVDGAADSLVGSVIKTYSWSARVRGVRQFLRRQNV